MHIRQYKQDLHNAQMYVLVCIFIKIYTNTLFIFLLQANTYYMIH